MALAFNHKIFAITEPDASLKLQRNDKIEKKEKQKMKKKR
jgi:hypothetical protein